MKDRAMQALHLLALEPVAETTADPNSYGFRSERSCQDAIEQCFNNHRFNCSSAWVIECDINGCFDNISQKWMLTHIPTDKVILQKWLKAGFIEKHSFFPTEAGTPQGGVISPVLANMTLDGLEGILRKYFPHHKKPKKNIYKVNIVRYADDFVITGTSKELLENEVMPLVKTFLVERGLELSSEKTRITHIEEGYDFLGKTVQKYNGKLLIKPSEKSINTFLRNVRAIIKENKALDQVKLIKRLNPIIRGWAEYHKHDVSKRVFGKVNSEIWRALWRWAKRRHPRKGRGWILRKYFHRIGSRSWVFAVPEESCELFDPRCIKIKRHVKIAAEANPFDPKWEEYFEKRIDLKMKDSIGGKKSLFSLWRSQDGICPTCNQKITKESGWNNHHITWKSKGGRRGNSNRVLLHPNCHRQVHNQGIKVVKPAPRKRG
jgi:RNA-directed DNA polymerase